MPKQFFLHMGDDHRATKNKLQEATRTLFYKKFNHTLTEDLEGTVEKMKAAVDEMSSQFPRCKRLGHCYFERRGRNGKGQCFYVSGLFNVSIFQVKEVDDA